MRALIGITLLVAGGCGDDVTPPPGDGGTDAGPLVFFEDVTDAAGVGFVRRPADGYDTTPDRIGGGVCVIDVDGTPPLDLFFPARRGQPSALFVGRGVLDYVDEAEARGLGDVGDALGCLAFDMEGDGDTDLFVTGYGTLGWHANEGGFFTQLAVDLDPPVDPRDIYASAAAGDVDGDGDLDILVAGYERLDPDALADDCGILPCAADLLPPIASRLLIREGSTWFDRTESVAPALLEAAPTFVVSIVDVDGDLAPELVEWNDLGDTYHNKPLARGDDGVFRDASLTLGLDVTRRGGGGDTMGWSSGDLDGDGRFDHVTSDYHGSSTAVFFCGEEGCFDDAPGARTTLSADSFRWGLALFDVDLDGDLDLLEAAGHLNRDEEVAMQGFAAVRDQPPNLLRWSDRRFEPTAPGASDALSIAHVGRGLAIVDLDDDGRLDAVIASADGSAALLRNTFPSAGHHLRVRLEGVGENADAVGAEVRLTSGTQTYLRRRIAGEGYLGSFDPRLHFGLPTAEPVDLEAQFWPSGAVVRMTGVPLDGEVVIRE